MTKEELNIIVHNHLKNIENSLNKIKELSHDEGNTDLHIMALDAEQCLVAIYKKIER